MKTYDLGAGLLVGIFIMAGASKINHDRNKAEYEQKLAEASGEVKKSDILVESGHAPKVRSKKAGTTYFLPSDATNLSAIMAQLKPGDKVLIVEPNTKTVTEVQEVKEPQEDKIEIKQSAIKNAPADNKPLTAVQEATKKALELMIDQQEKKTEIPATEKD